MKGGHEWWKYIYNEYYDCMICSEFQALEYSTTNQDGYREYKEYGIYYTIDPKQHEYPEDTRELAVKMYYGGIRGRRVGKNWK